MFDAESVGRKISVLRKKSGITQMELANRLGLSFQAVSNWERGVAMPDIGNLKLLAQILNTTVDDILGDERAAKIISDVEEGKTPSEPVKPAEFLAVAPLLEPEQNDALIGAVKDPFTKEEVKEAVPNLAFGGEYDKSDAELAEMFFERSNVAMFAMVEGGLSGERRRELLHKAISRGDMAFIAMLSDAMTGDDAVQFAEKAFGDGNVGLFAMFDDRLSRERRGELAMQAFESGNIAIFSMLQDNLSPEQRRVCRNKAAADGNVAMFAILHDSVSGDNKNAPQNPPMSDADSRKRALLDKFTALSNRYADLGEKYNRLRISGADQDELNDLEDQMNDLKDELNDIQDELSEIEENRADEESFKSAGEKLSGLKGLFDKIGKMFN
jgi:Predicted transcriptional regulators